jgi:hypothetical protein
MLRVFGMNNNLTFQFPLVFIVILLLGCSQSATVPDSDQLEPPKLANGETYRWNWGIHTIVFSDDYSQVDVIAERGLDLHINVNKFVEGPPCPNCLKIGKPHGSGYGSIKLPVILSHPFPGHPEWTGFDVRGIAVFKATTYYWTMEGGIGEGIGSPWLMDDPLFYYSDPDAGGAAVLNNDGYTFYLNPLLIYEDRPYLNYSKGKKAVGDSPDCTINPYLLFSDGSPRRMFKTKDVIQRIYDIKPPESPFPFEFGYVVSACWAQPDKVPVTDPANDFPIIANCEDPYRIEAEQLLPVSYDIAGEPMFKVTVCHRKGE